MKTYQFQGYSDDIFGALTSGIHDDNCATGRPIQFELTMPDGAGLRITGCYGTKAHGATMGNGCWMIGVEALDEEKPVNWKLTLEPSFQSYKGRLIVEAPEEAVLSLLKP